MVYTYEYNNTSGIITMTNEDGQILAKGLFNPFKPSDIYNEERLNIFIEVIECIEDNTQELKVCLVNEFIKQATIIKEAKPDLPVYLYHCCFAEDSSSISFYSSIEGFKHTEGMYSIHNKITCLLNTSEIEGVKFQYLTLEENQIHQLIDEQNKVFKSGYVYDDLIAIRNSEKWFSLSALYEDQIIGNIMILIKEDEQGNIFAWIDDLFVKKEFRKLGVGQELVNRGLNRLYTMGISSCKLEVWSSNERAYSIYKKAGFEFLKETEVSIGMFL